MVVDLYNKTLLAKFILKKIKIDLFKIQKILKF